MQATFVIMGLFLLQIPQRYARQEAIVLLVQLYQLVAQWVSIMVVLELQMRVSVGLVQQETIALLMIVWLKIVCCFKLVFLHRWFLKNVL